MVTTMSGRNVPLGFAVRHARHPTDQKKDGEQGSHKAESWELSSIPVFLILDPPHSEWPPAATRRASPFTHLPGGSSQSF